MGLGKNRMKGSIGYRAVDSAKGRQSMKSFVPYSLARGKALMIEHETPLSCDNDGLSVHTQAQIVVGRHA